MTLPSELSTIPLRISVVIPTHRERGFIDETVLSVVRSIRDDDEIIVVPNGSTTDYVARLRRDFSQRCTFVELAGGGVAKARNAGFATATGDAVIFLDDDDVLEEGGLEQLRTLLATNPTWSGVVGEVTRFGMTSQGAPERYPGPLAPISDLWLIGQCITSPGAVLLRREFVAATGGFSQDYAPSEDLEFWLRLTLIQPVIGVHVPMLRYRVHDAAVSGNPAAMARQHVRIFRRHVQHLGDMYPLSVRLAAIKVVRWYLPRLHKVRHDAIHVGKWSDAMAAMRTVCLLYWLFITASVRAKLSLLADGKWQAPADGLSRELAHRGHSTSSTVDAP